MSLRAPPKHRRLNPRSQLCGHISKSFTCAVRRQSGEGAGAGSPDLEAVVDEMVEAFGLASVPLLRLAENGQAPGGAWNEYETDYALPTKAFLDGKMTVLSVDEYSADPPDFL